MFIENNLSDAMVDERFVEQYSKYSPTIKNIYYLTIFSYSNRRKRRYITPSGSVYNKVDIGNLSKDL